MSEDAVTSESKGHADQSGKATFTVKGSPKVALHHSPSPDAFVKGQEGKQNPGTKTGEKNPQRLNGKRLN